MRLTYDWLMVSHHTMVELRYVSKGCGVECVIDIGTIVVLEWCVANWDMMDVSLHCYPFTKIMLCNNYSLHPTGKPPSFTKFIVFVDSPSGCSNLQG